MSQGSWKIRPGYVVFLFPLILYFSDDNDRIHISLGRKSMVKYPEVDVNGSNLNLNEGEEYPSLTDVADVLTR